MRPYYIVPDGKVGHDAYAVIRETIRSLDKVALARVVLTNREHVIALEARDKGLMGMLLRYPYEVRAESEYFDDIQDVKITKEMLELARHIVDQKSGHFEPDKFEDHYEAALKLAECQVGRSSPAFRPGRVASKIDGSRAEPSIQRPTLGDIEALSLKLVDESKRSAGLLDSSNRFGLGQTAIGSEKRMGEVPIESTATSKSAMGC